MAEIKKLGKLNAQLLEHEFGKLATDEVVVTDERMAHIVSRHPEDVALFRQYARETVEQPDLIIKDEKNADTVFMVRRLAETNLNVVVRLSLETDEDGRKNSVMTFYRIRSKNLQKLMRRHKMLYKRESLCYNESTIKTDI